MRFDSKNFNAQAFGHFVNRAPNVNKTELAKCKAVGKNEQAALALSSQTGSLYAKVPYYGNISGSTSQNNDGSTDVQATNTATFTQGFITASRMDSWTERNFSTNITAGVDFMKNIAGQISTYKMEVKQAILLHMLSGVFSMGTGDDIAGQAAEEFISKHTYNLPELGGDVVEADTLNKAIQRASGDNKNAFKLAIMHSEVATNLENMKLLKYLTQTDGDGITRDLSLGSWNGRLVLIDDNMPTTTASSTTTYEKTADTEIDPSKTYYTKPNANYVAVTEPEEAALSSYYESVTAETGDTLYTTYLLGENSINLDAIGDAVPFEMSRDAKTNGGQDTLFVRDRYICGVSGVSFNEPSFTASASNTELARGANWSIIHNDREAIPHKAIALSRIISYG